VKRKKALLFLLFYSNAFGKQLLPEQEKQKRLQLE